MAIRSLVEFIYREGDIDASLRSGVTPQEGQRIHQLVQSKYIGFQKEVALKYQAPIAQNITLVLSGRMDGVKDDEQGVVIDEIKSVFGSVDDLEESHSFLHWAQAMLYGAIYLVDHEADGVTIQLTYYSLRNEDTRIFQRYCEKTQLNDFLEDALSKYRKWVVQEAIIIDLAERSANDVQFPYKQFRAGQDTLAKACFQSIREGHHLIAEAPTGIGKTLSTLFPALKALGRGITSRIFYLTSKTIHRRVALDAMAQLEEQGVKLITVGLQAKEKMCLNDLFKCQPDVCPYARGHFDRVNEVLFEMLLEGGHYDPERIKAVAEDGVVCPFELALDLTDFAQVIIGDYNYYLDPFVQLKRHFMEPSSAVVLIDEAHNLYERSRDMYTAILTIEATELAIKAAKACDEDYLKQLRKYKRVLKESILLGDEMGRIEGLDLKLLNAINSLMLYFSDQGRFTGISTQDACVNHYFELHRLNRLMEYYDDHFVFMVDTDQEHVILRCLDPSKLLMMNYEKVRSVIAFSATLSPFSFYQSVLGHRESKRLQVGSPFDVKNRLLGLNLQHSTYQKDRAASLNGIASDIRDYIQVGIGNYFVFCPSYAYTEMLAQALEPMLTDVDLSVQQQMMSERDRESFLEAFEPSPKRTRVGMVVLGGAFSEGIDLRGDRLTGVVIVGVGMPTVTRERQLMCAFYDAQGESGFDFAYTYPGLNKVYQAGGRLIRTEEDKGTLMLICKRFGERRYLKEFPRHWNPHRLIRNSKDYNAFLKEMHMFLPESIIKP